MIIIIIIIKIHPYIAIKSHSRSLKIHCSNQNKIETIKNINIIIYLYVPLVLWRKYESEMTAYLQYTF